MTTTKKAKSPTFKAGADTYTLHLGMAALIAMEKHLGTALSDLGKMMQEPKLSTVRDLFAAMLIENHPQEDGASALAKGLNLRLMGGEGAPAIVSWPAQTALANKLLDLIGIDKASELFEATIAASPHVSGGEAKVA